MPQKPLAKLAVIMEVPGENPRLEFFGEAGSIKSTWRKWCDLWEDFQKEGLRLTFQEINSNAKPTPPNPENRFRISPFNQHRGIVPSPFETRCNFGSEGCQVHLGFHKTKKTAERQFLRMWDCYGRRPGEHAWLRSTKVLSKSKRNTPAAPNKNPHVRWVRIPPVTELVDPSLENDLSEV